MRVAVISDIHGNLHALEAVLAALDAERPDELWCLGDLVGYGPRPNDVTALVRERADVCLVGNHDLAVLGVLDLAEFSSDAAASARWTQQALADGARAYLEALRPEERRRGVHLCHGSPRDPVWEYVLTGESALAALLDADGSLVLVGHSHVALAISLVDGTLAGGLAAAGTEVRLEDRLLLNPGSVGQPRDGDPRAAFLLVDLASGLAAFRRVTYPVERTQAEIVEAGLPTVLAERLAAGQ